MILKIESNLQLVVRYGAGEALDLIGAGRDRGTLFAAALN